MPKGSQPPPGEFSLAVSRLLAFATDELGVSHTSLARQVGVSQPQMSRYLRGERSMTIDELDRICSVLGFDMVRLAIAANEERNL